jgi:hypothetical protein
MKYIISILIIICPFSIDAMEKPLGKRSATEALSETRELEKKPAVDKRAQEFFPIESLPPEIQYEIVKALTNARGATKRARLDNAAENIRSFFRTNRFFKSFENDQELINYLITKLANAHADGDKIAAAIALGTRSALRWLAQKIYPAGTLTPEEISKRDELFYSLKKNFLNAVRDNRFNVIDFLLWTFNPAWPIWNDMLREALVHAIANNQINVINKILSHQRVLPAKLTILNATDPTTLESLLFSAVRMNRPQIVALFIAAGVNVNQVNDSNETPLQFAAAGPYPTIVQMLIDAHADTNIADEVGLTALMLAAQYGSIDAVNLLINAGADVAHEDNLGHSALWYAETYAQKNKDQILKILRDHGAN